MSRHLKQACRQIVKLYAILAVVFLVVPDGHAQRAVASSASPFAGMNGSWRGNGVVTLKGGTRERIRCRARYSVSGNNSLRQRLRCASDSYKFVLSSNVSHRNGRILGQWWESTRNLAGRVVGSARGTRISARIIGDIFSAFVAVTTHGRSQRVTIRSPGSKLESVSISLRRSR